MPKLGTCCNSSERPHLMLFCFLKYPSRRSVGGKWETQPRFPSGPRPRLFHNQTNPHTLDKTDSRSAPPDFLSKTVTSVDCMRLSLRRAAYVAAGRAVK